jgi:hypothetical protein
MTASLTPDANSPSRRALLAGALGGLGALAASAIGRPRTAHANDPFDVLLGGTNISGDTTVITNNSTPNHAFSGGSTSSGTGVRGISVSGVGIAGDSTSGAGVTGGSSSSIGVKGFSSSHIAIHGFSLASGQPATVGWAGVNSTGVQGYSNNGTGSLPAAKAKTGVYGYAGQDNASQGVWGHSPAGNGVVGSTATGYAGYFSGKVYSTQFYELSEIGTPAAPAANRARLFVKDNGAGKTQLCVRFHTGAVQVIKTEP